MTGIRQLIQEYRTLHCTDCMVRKVSVRYAAVLYLLGVLSVDDHQPGLRGELRMLGFRVNVRPAPLSAPYSCWLDLRY
jgi:hypothetical protein